MVPSHSQGSPPQRSLFGGIDGGILRDYCKEIDAQQIVMSWQKIPPPLPDPGAAAKTLIDPQSDGLRDAVTHHPSSGCRPCPRRRNEKPLLWKTGAQRPTGADAFGRFSLVQIERSMT